MISSIIRYPRCFMIDDEKTFQKYGYRTSDLSIGSSKKIVTICDYCSDLVDKPYKARLNQNKELDKDCCIKCKFKKREELSLLKYGVKNSAQRVDVKSKLTNYNIEEYKDEIVSLLDQGYSVSNISDKLDIPKTSLSRYLISLGLDTKGNIQAKRDLTIKEKYGEDYQEQMLKKRTITNLQKYGTANPFENEEIKNKIKKTMKDKYGYEHHMMNPDKVKQAQTTNLQKYGYHNVAQVPEFQEKIKETNLEKYGYESATKNPIVKSKIVNTMVANGNARLFEGLDAKAWAEKTGYCLSRFNQLVKQYGFENAKYMYRTDSYSSLELHFRNFLDQHNISYSQQFRVNDNNKLYIADFKLNDNLLIECDGLYWHSDAARDSYKYHIDKQQAYSSQNYTSLFFREDEIREKFSIVESMVLNKLNRSNRIYARVCSFDKLNTKEADNYFLTNHLMGTGKGDTYILKFKEEIVAGLRLKRLKDKEYEISRFCNRNFNTVVGAFSKLLHYAIQDKQPSSIITFIDQRYGKGVYLTNLGFNYVHTYPSFRWTDGFETFHRLKFPGNSGYDNGLFKLWDCGQAKWILKR